MFDWTLNALLQLNFNSLSVNPQNGQTHSNNPLAVANELFECV